MVFNNETIPRPSGTVFGPGQEVFVYSAHREVSCKKKTLLYLEFLLWTTNIQTGAGCCWLMKACLHSIAPMWKACSKLYVGHVPGKKCAPETEPVFGKVVPAVQDPIRWLSGYKPWEAYKFEVSSISFLIYRQRTTGVTGRNTRQASKKSTPLPVTTTEVEQVQQEPSLSARNAATPQFLARMEKRMLTAISKEQKIRRQSRLTNSSPNFNPKINRFVNKTLNCWTECSFEATLSQWTASESGTKCPEWNSEDGKHLPEIFKRRFHNQSFCCTADECLCTAISIPPIWNAHASTICQQPFFRPQISSDFASANKEKKKRKYIKKKVKKQKFESSSSDSEENSSVIFQQKCLEFCAFPQHVHQALKLFLRSTKYWELDFIHCVCPTP